MGRKFRKWKAVDDYARLPFAFIWLTGHPDSLRLALKFTHFGPKFMVEIILAYIISEIQFMCNIFSLVVISIFHIISILPLESNN